MKGRECKFIEFNFIEDNGYGRTLRRENIYDFCYCLRHSGLTPMLDVWKLVDSLYILFSKEKMINDKELYKKLTTRIINNCKKNNRGVTDRKLNKRVRKYVHNEIDYCNNIYNTCITLYGRIFT